MYLCTSKSLQREVNTRWGTPRIVQEKILKQSITKAENGRIEGLIVSLDKTKNSSKFIYQSFYPEVDFKKNECVMHINKDSLDNRIENLKKVTRKKSKQTDMVKSVRTIIATQNRVLFESGSNQVRVCFGKRVLFPNKTAP